MNLRQSVNESLTLICSRDRRILIMLIGIQAGLALLDLVAIGLLGIVVALSASAMSGGVPEIVTSLLTALGLEEADILSVSLALALVAAVLLVSRSITSFLVSRRTLRFLATRQSLVSGRLAASLLAQPLLFIQRRSSQETAYALTAGVNATILGVIGNAVMIASEFALVAVLIVGLAIVDLPVMIFTIIFFALIGVLLHKILASWAGELGTKSTRAEVASYASIQEVMRTYREVTVFARRRMYVENFQKLRWEAAGVQADLQIMNQVSKYVFEIGLIIGAILLAVSQLFTRDIAASLSVIVIFVAAASRMMPSLLRMQGATLNIRSSAATAKITLDLYKELEVHKSSETLPILLDSEIRKRVELGIAQGHSNFEASIHISHVQLSYPGTDHPAISDVSLKVKSGTSLALVGSTGAGKSTLADLILGVLVPDAGTVTIGGAEPSKAITQSPGAVAYVPQDIALINGTIADNVALGITDELVINNRVWEALERAELADFLREQRDGLDTIVGEHGVRLSGGQRQRLGLARAFYTRPKLIVLDEATSALDAETEQAVSKTLKNLEGEVTLVIIAHRLATIRHCDQVAYLNKGRLDAIGSFEEVRETAPNFDHQARILGL